MSATFQPDSTPPARSTSGLKIVLIVLAVLGILGLLVCGGFAALMYFGWGQIQSQMGEEFRRQLAGNPVLEQEIGELQTVNINIMETRADEESGLPQMVMDVEGAEGQGTVVATLSNEGDNRIVAATLQTEDGRTVELPIENNGTAFDESDIDTGEPVTTEETVEVDEQTEADVDAPVEAEAP